MDKISQCIETGNKLYYVINPNSKMDVPSFFYERLEKEYDKWGAYMDGFSIIEKSDLSFYDYCLKKMKI